MALPYLNAHGLITRVLDKIISASQPERFTQDFRASKLGFDSGSARPIIPLEALAEKLSAFQAIFG